MLKKNASEGLWYDIVIDVIESLTAVRKKLRKIKLLLGHIFGGATFSIRASFAWPNEFPCLLSRNASRLDFPNPIHFFPNWPDGISKQPLLILRNSKTQTHRIQNTHQYSMYCNNMIHLNNLLLYFILLYFGPTTLLSMRVSRCAPQALESRVRSNTPQALLESRVRSNIGKESNCTAGIGS